MSRSLSSLWAVAAAVTVGFTLACGSATVAGSRAESGICPAGERCSPDTPEGLLFTGQFLYDEPIDRIGPVLVGGEFQMHFAALAGEVGNYAIEVDRTAEVRDLGDQSLVIRGLGVGSAQVRIVDADNGELYDFVKVEVVEIEDIEMSNVSEPGREVLYAGCEEMVGVRLLSEQGEFRAFDETISFSADVGSVTPDVAVWDCFRFDVPATATEVTFEVVAGGEAFSSTIEVVPVGPEGCPELSD